MRKTFVWIVIGLMVLGIGAGAFQAFRGLSGQQTGVNTTLSDTSGDTLENGSAETEEKPAYNTREQVYANAHPDFSESEVKRDIRLGLDKPLYEEAGTVSDPDAVDVFVSKHWQLPDGYVPADLTDIQGVRLREPAARAWEALQSELSEAGIPVYLQSGWISADETESLYSQAVEKYGQERADLVFARPGFFDSNTGLSVDFGLEGVEDPATDSRYPQIVDAAIRHGFIVRYKADNEALSQTAAMPVHLRYVGPKLAQELTETGQSFDEYYGTH
ncbi:M15 family metallopeptidase [Faecalibaculum rodentium]|uniref:M15 family metallopeptidase n=3 Tax=Faecalibaculum rodentium TaxID=1702221 RepID=UPI00260F7EAB|nr:M15 family metallopeptidase [Faecalibaculum rodentium]